MRPIKLYAALSSVLAAGLAVAPLPASASSFFFSTGNPNGLLGALSRPSTGGVLETETADDFVLTSQTQLTSATFTGLITGPGQIGDVGVEIYRVFPQDSGVGTPQVPTRVNSPSDV